MFSSITTAANPLSTITRMTEWGPARHNPENPFSVEKTAQATIGKYFECPNLAADDQQRPEDN